MSQLGSEPRDLKDFSRAAQAIRGRAGARFQRPDSKPSALHCGDLLHNNGITVDCLPFYEISIWSFATGQQYGWLLVRVRMSVCWDVQYTDFPLDSGYSPN